MPLTEKIYGKNEGTLGKISTGQSGTYRITYEQEPPKSFRNIEELTAYVLAMGTSHRFELAESDTSLEGDIRGAIQTEMTRREVVRRGLIK